MAATNLDQVVASTNPGFVGNLQGGQIEPPTVITGDGAVAVAPGATALTKASAAAITIAAPTAGTHDGYIVDIYSETAQAHVITCASDGFNAKGGSGTITFAGAKGNSVRLIARNGHWWVIGNIGGTVA